MDFLTAFKVSKELQKALAYLKAITKIALACFNFFSAMKLAGIEFWLKVGIYRNISNICLEKEDRWEAQ